jgi:predicted CoA-binding protein
MNVAVLGASAKQERYSYKALKLLAEKGHTVFPVNPGLNEIEKIKVYHSLPEIKEKIDVVTVYLSPERSSPLADEIISVSPIGIIFNPGAENNELCRRLAENGIETLNACTIVMLISGEFEKWIKKLR